VKIGELHIDLPGANAPGVEARDLDLSADEFKAITGLLEQITTLQLEIEQLRTRPH